MCLGEPVFCLPMKPVKNCPHLNKLARSIEFLDEILESHARAKIILLSEHRKIKELRHSLLEKYKELSRKALFG